MTIPEAVEGITGAPTVRIQRRRAKGWRMPEGAVYVGRPSRWGNPYRVGACEECQVGGPHEGRHRALTAADAVDGFRALVPFIVRQDDIEPLRAATALACWCPLDQPCHADVLIELLS